MEHSYKEVYFTKCKDCKYEKRLESEEPCWTCLNEPKREHSHTPIKFEPKKEGTK